jgi:hypothetical protein
MPAAVVHPDRAVGVVVRDAVEYVHARPPLAAGVVADRQLPGRLTDVPVLADDDLFAVDARLHPRLDGKVTGADVERGCVTDVDALVETDESGRGVGIASRTSGSPSATTPRYTPGLRPVSSAATVPPASPSRQ